VTGADSTSLAFYSTVCSFLQNKLIENHKNILPHVEIKLKIDTIRNIDDIK